jgi:hypothetical protein
MSLEGRMDGLALSLEGRMVHDQLDLARPMSPLSLTGNTYSVCYHRFNGAQRKTSAKDGVMRGKRAGIGLQLAHKTAIEDLLRNTSIPCL